MEEAEIKTSVISLYDKLEKVINKKLHNESNEYAIQVSTRALVLLVANVIDALIQDEHHDKKLEFSDIMNKMIKKYLISYEEYRKRKVT